MQLQELSTIALPAYELTGPPGAPLVIVLGGISATRHVAAHDGDPRPGWWDSIVGARKAIDSRRVRVLGVDYLDGGRTASGRPARIVTTHDQASAIAAVLDQIGAARAAAIVGSSYGGMVALAFAETRPERVEQVVVISASHEPHPMTTALRSVQRGIVELGVTTGSIHEALVLARSLAMTTYRSAAEFGARFATGPVRRTERDARFAVEDYLRHHGQAFAAEWSAERFLALSLSADLHRVNPGAIRTPTVLVAAQGDRVVPASQMRALAAMLGGPARLVHLPSTRGHDAFLTEPEMLGRLLTQHLDLRRVS